MHANNFFVGQMMHVIFSDDSPENSTASRDRGGITGGPTSED